MRLFLKKLALFLVPFVLLGIVAEISYTKSGGDLNRLGKIPYPKDYRNQFHEVFNQEKRYHEFSELHLDSVQYVDVLTIGDSFSQQGAYGYQNYLAIEQGLDVVNFDYKTFALENYKPLHFLYQMLNSDIFEHVKADYIILQIVERDILRHLNDLNEKKGLTITDLFENIKAELSLNEKYQNSTFRMRMNDMVHFYRYGLLYCFNDRAFESSVYKKKLSKPLFSANEDMLLFYDRDISNMNNYSNAENVKQFNNILNRLNIELKALGIDLIVMPCADKYDIYYDYIIGNRHRENLFFENLKVLPKDYLYIDTKAVLKPYIDNGVKDVYFADDTHWSPIATKLIAEEVYGLIQ
ncbi:alginate O-acetyltransferase AlgX-related protein [Aestuariivivens marinum]|uniref:alginate O-acetyltransferase AlgX-related protein n=1 Tax=Aestuariivivens marinum TaxID=2913555 RepID=UPI001F57B864|nr:hypothetical protein [Aestuariivivens marinum]